MSKAHLKDAKGAAHPAFKHGLSYSSEYRAWQTMRLRCMVPTNRAYPSYGGRGITVCDRWLNSVANFIADMGAKPTPKHELDRIDNDGPYSPENCRWATRSQNDRNRRSNTWVEFRGERMTLAELCERLDIPYNRTCDRINKGGWSVEDAALLPHGHYREGRGAPGKQRARVPA